MSCKTNFQFSAVEDFDQAKSVQKAEQLLDTFITGGLRLAWMMVTQIPPMIAISPTKFSPHCTIFGDFNENDVALTETISLRPIIYFSYEGEVAVQGIITPTNHGSENQNTAGTFLFVCKICRYAVQINGTYCSYF